jgi:hypothetical protein
MTVVVGLGQKQSPLFEWMQENSFLCDIIVLVLVSLISAFNHDMLLHFMRMRAKVDCPIRV